VSGTAPPQRDDAEGEDGDCDADPLHHVAEVRPLVECGGLHADQPAGAGGVALQEQVGSGRAGTAIVVASTAIESAIA
jgi:hypothetical protein